MAMACIKAGAHIFMEKPFVHGKNVGVKTSLPFRLCCVFHRLSLCFTAFPCVFHRVFHRLSLHFHCLPLRVSLPSSA